MTKILIKKQLAETLSMYTKSKSKKNEGKRSKGNIALLVCLYVFCFGMLAVMFTELAGSLCPVYVSIGFDWTFFSYFTIISIVLGLIGGAFTTYSSLYKAKDNEMLLSMPILPSSILAARLVVVWLWSVVYSGLCFVPALVVYQVQRIKFGYDFSAYVLICGIILFIIITLVVLVLSCLLGFVIAKLSSRFEGKSYLVVISALLFIGLYYFFYYKATNIMADLVENALLYGEKFEHSPLYTIGAGGVGDIASLCIFGGISVAAFAIVVWVMSKTFIKMVTVRKGRKKAVLRQVGDECKTVGSALLSKERSRFTTSATYMLNTALGSFFALIAVVAAIIMNGKLYILLTEAASEFRDMMPVIACGICCAVATMNDISAPSVSLEGKSIWILQSLPITPFDALKAKLKLHYIVTEVPIFVLSIVAWAVLRCQALDLLFIVAIPALFVFVTDALNLFFGIKFANLDWVNEMVPVKQGAAAGISIFANMGIAGILVVFYVLVGMDWNVYLFLCVCMAILAAAGAALYMWIAKKGTKIFANL